MKKIKIRSFISPLLSLIVIALVFALISSASVGDPFSAKPQEIITAIDFTPDNHHADSFEKVSENQRFILKVNMRSALVRLEDKTTGAVWMSSPEGYDADPDIKGAAKVSLGSLLNIRYADRDSNKATQNAVVGSVNRGNMNAQKIENGVRFEFYFDKEGFLIPYELLLNETGMISRIPIDDIVEASSSVKLLSIIPMPNFGAGKEGEDGYLVVPDGSGALITFEKGLSVDQSQRIYGKDLAVVEKTRSEVPGVARLPIFGIRNKDNAFLAIITNGGARASVNATVSSSKSPYFQLESEFVYRESVVVDVSQKTFEFTRVNMFEPEHTALESFETQYYFMDESGQDYVGMANTYRDYLIREKGMSSITEKRAPLYVELFGGVRRRESVLGIPVSKVVPVTSYDDVKTIHDGLTDRGIEDVVYNYMYWSKGGTDSVLPVKMRTESSLGSRSDFKSMLVHLQENGAGIFLNIELTELNTSIPGFSRKFSSAQSVQREPVILYGYKMSTFQIDQTAKQVYLLKPAKILKAAEDVLKNAGKFEFTGFSAESICRTIYSDFGSEPVDRGSSQIIWESSIKSIAGSHDRFLVSEGNAYAIPYATDLINTPITTGKYLAQDHEIPFYQIAVHGLAVMATTPLNAAEDSRTAFLKAIESGISLNYTFGAENIDKLAGTAYSDRSYISYDLWLEEAAENFSEISEYLKDVSDQKIIGHEQIENGVYRTLFSNGTGAVVNYTDKDIVVDGIRIGPENYVIIKKVAE